MSPRDILEQAWRNVETLEEERAELTDRIVRNLTGGESPEERLERMRREADKARPRRKLDTPSILGFPVAMARSDASTGRITLGTGIDGAIDRTRVERAEAEVARLAADLEEATAAAREVSVAVCNALDKVDKRLGELQQYFDHELGRIERMLTPPSPPLRRDALRPWPQPSDLN